MKRTILAGETARAVYEQVLRADAERRGVRFDAGETAAFARQFENIEAELYRYVYGPEAQWRTIFPVVSAANWAEFSTHRMINRVGEADEVDDLATDFPHVEIVGEEATQPIRSYGASFSYSIDDVRKALYAGMDITSEKALVAREAIERKVDRVMAFGDARMNIPSFVNNSSVPAVFNAFTPVTASTKTSGTQWNAAANAGDVTKILQDIEAMVIAIRSATLNGFGPAAKVDLIVGTSGWNFLMETAMKTTNFVRETYGSYILANMPSIEAIKYWPQLDTVGAGGKERIMMKLTDRRVAGGLLPVDFEMTPPEARGFGWRVNARSKSGGVVVRYPKGVAWMDGTMV